MIHVLVAIDIIVDVVDHVLYIPLFRLGLLVETLALAVLAPVEGVLALRLLALLQCFHDWQSVHFSLDAIRDTVVVRILGLEANGLFYVLQLQELLVTLELPDFGVLQQVSEEGLEGGPPLFDHGRTFGREQGVDVVECLDDARGRFREPVVADRLADVLVQLAEVLVFPVHTPLRPVLQSDLDHVLRVRDLVSRLFHHGLVDAEVQLTHLLLRLVTHLFLLDRLFTLLRDPLA